MNTNKIIIGFAQSDNNYGLSKNKNFSEVANNLKKYGIKSIDTAPTYINSDKIINQIKDISTYKIFTKLPTINCHLKNLKRETNLLIDQILSKNTIKNIDTLLIHDPLLPLNNKRWRIIYGCLKKHKTKGIIKNIGISVYTVNEVLNILKVFKPDVIQFPLNIFNQEFIQGNLLKNLKKKKIILIARSLFLQGALCQKSNNNKVLDIWRDKFDKWQGYLIKKKMKAEEVCLKFALSIKTIDYFILGVDNLDQLKKNIKIVKSNNKSFTDDLDCFYEENDFLNDPRYWNKKINLKFLKDWELAKKYIHTGNMLLSKKPDQFLPGGWPVFYKKAQGCYFWDKYNDKYIDFSLMGVGTNIMDYSNKSINHQLKKILDFSNVSTLNSEYDLKLSQKLISMHPWASKSMFARTGAEANAVALRIARAYSNKDEVAICGYHGWHDWYLSSNLKNNKTLDQIHLPGLSTIGIPKKLEGLTHLFKYNDLNSLKRIIKNNENIGTIFMEVQRNEKPRNNFLKEVRKLADKYKLVLIFDECTSGFRETFGGLHKKYNMNPDIAVFGKSIANGIPLTAIIGKKDVMDKAKKSFISSTFWTDNLGPASALLTIQQMEKTKSWKIITTIGKKIKIKWKMLSNKYQIPIEISGLDSMPMFKFKSLKNQYYKSYITQEMLKQNFLASNIVYCCVEHSKYIKVYFNHLDRIFKRIKEFENGKNITQYLDYPISKSGFGRLN